MNQGLALGKVTESRLTNETLRPATPSITPTSEKSQSIYNRDSLNSRLSIDSMAPTKEHDTISDY
jgi:hypothetical protein